MISGDGSLTSTYPLKIYQYPQIEFQVLYPGSGSGSPDPTPFAFDYDGDYFPVPDAHYQTPTAMPMLGSSSWLEITMDPGVEDWLTINAGPNTDEYTLSAAWNYGVQIREGYIHFRASFLGLPIGPMGDDYSQMEGLGLSKVISIPVTQNPTP